MAKRRRNEDGTLVVPLSDKQRAALARGRAALVAKAADEPRTKETGASAKAPAGGGSVEVVTVTKASRSRTKAAGGSTGTRRTKASTGGSPSRRSSKPPPEAPAASVSKESPGAIERFARWLAST